jgi:hypothetical protein
MEGDTHEGHTRGVWTGERAEDRHKGRGREDTHEGSGMKGDTHEGEETNTRIGVT